MKEVRVAVKKQDRDMVILLPNPWDEQTLSLGINMIYLRSPTIQCLGERDQPGTAIEQLTATVSTGAEGDQDRFEHDTQHSVRSCSFEGKQK